MNIHQRGLRRVSTVLGSPLLILIFSSAGSGAGVATLRLSTGLPPSSTPNGLSQAWVAPVETPPNLDGRLDEPAWAAARPVVLGKLESHGPAAPRTEARLVRHARNLYVGLRMAEPNVSGMRRAVTQPDGPAYSDDSIELFLMPRRDREYFQIVVSATGAVYDRQGHGEPSAWTSGAKARTSVDKDGWSAEIAIPLEAMGVGDTLPARLRANIYRNRQAGPEGKNQAWSPTFRGDYDVPERFGELLLADRPPGADLRRDAGHAHGITAERLDSGDTVLQFDLARLSGKRIYRAWLRAERGPSDPSDPDALAEIEVYPLSAPPKADKIPKVQSDRLQLAGPGLRALDLTAAVRAWAAAGQAGAVLVKKFPGWKIDGTFLEVAYEGQPEELPPQAGALKVFHRAGQTFITFREAEPLLNKPVVTWGEIRTALASADGACRYRIYVHDRPITAANLAEASVLADVDPLSGYNKNGRNVEYLIGQAMVQPDEIGELARDYNGYMHSWHMDHPRMDRYPVPRLVVDEKAGPLPVGSGLYVHHPPSAGRRCYAVVTCRRGTENTRDFSAANSLEQSVAETPGLGEPVCQGEGLRGPYFDYPGRRKVYVEWCAPPLAPRANMYFNWSVLVPPGIEGRAPAELYFHPAGYSYAQPGKKLLLHSIQIAPHDYPQSGWYGFNEAWGTLQSPRAAKVGDHTQRRILAFLDWAKRSLPIDPDRLLAVGGDGAALTALRSPDLFAAVFVTGFDQQALNLKAADRLAAAWGPKLPEIKDGQGQGNWAWAELDKLVLGAAHTDLPLFVCRGPSWGRIEGWGKGRGRFYDAMQQSGQPLVAHWAWGGKLIAPDKHTGLWQDVELRRDRALPAFLRCSLDKEGEGSGNANAGFRWREVRDDPQKFEVTVTGQSCTFDLMPRRLRALRIRPAERLRWTAEPLPGGHGKPSPPQQGQAVADKHGLVTLPGLKLAVAGLKITITRAK